MQGQFCVALTHRIVTVHPGESHQGIHNGDEDKSHLKGVSVVGINNIRLEMTRRGSMPLMMVGGVDEPSTSTCNRFD